MDIKNTTKLFTNFFDANPRLKNYLPQALTLFFIIFVIGYFTYNAQVNMDNRGIDFGFRFLGEESSFDIQFSLIEYSGASTYARAYLVGLLNTILVAVIGIFFASILGVVIGISRLSPNYLIAKVAEWYIEIFRNIPLLLQLFFWYFAALRALPLPKEAINFFDISYLSVKGLYVPKFVWTNFDIFLYSIIASIIAIIFVLKYARKQQEQTGRRIPSFFISVGIIILIPLFTFLFGGVSLTFEYPVLKQMSETIYNYVGGVSIIPELMALALALSLYTATFIAECVRAGILGVTKGQKEAAASIGLTPVQVLRLVIMPQALRIIIPPTTNQYLNLTKNSSLAAAIAYPDIVLVFAGTAMMQTGRAIEIVSITMLTYLSLSIVISIFMNWYNRKMAIKEK
ncbi:MAG: ABC transporter permease subunit [Pelagibacteraceae bacterium]|jgi:general L-amino acid transport system permease protein|nr:amino acid ABC transporter permease [Candidatus Pelagibacter sp.]MDP6710336.1 ABC transporter permease subunit [Pelagibacteraceae bacterium]|tara:strand:+ start:1153 stop:2349 length:1197 start_codon:yes stop_codon:yes gene_type:complete